MQRIIVLQASIAQIFPGRTLAARRGHINTKHADCFPHDTVAS